MEAGGKAWDSVMSFVEDFNKPSISTLPKTNLGNQTSCSPCAPYPVDTIGSQGPKTAVRGVHGTRNGTGKEHCILFEVQQNPSTFQCRWQENKKIAGHHYMLQPTIFMSVNLNGKSWTPSYP